MFVPVLNLQNQPLMPTTPSRARRWIMSGKAVGFWKKGVFCVRLKVSTEENKQKIAVGIDPGSKREAFTVKSNSHTFLNIQTETVDWVSKAVETRSNMRKSRRNRKTPCRKNRQNRSRGGLPPSAKARWQWKLRVLNWLGKLFPITHIVVEDIKAKTTGGRKWNKSFSPLQVGKKWFYSQIPGVILRRGWETAQMREELGLKKTKDKLSEKFEAHCVDSWVLANSVVGGHNTSENTNILHLKPLRFHRRQLHVLQPTKGGKRKNYGGTISLGFKRGSLVKHHKYGLCYVGGTSKNRISVHSIENGKRLAQNCKTENCKFLTYNSWIFKKGVNNPE